jgi:hypothetical protein
MTNRVFALGLAVVAMQLASQAQPADNRSPEQAEPAIRAALGELTMATFQGDIKTFRALSTKRTLGLYDVLFEVLTSGPGAKDQLAKVGVKNGADFLANSLKTAAAAQKIDAKPIAKKNADTATIEFRSANEALVKVPEGSSWGALWEGNAWKLDSTDTTKKNLLQSPLLLRLPAAQRKRVEDY